MNQTRKMWVSAAAVGVILVGGVTVAAAASAGRLDQVRQTRAVVEKATPSSPLPTPDPTEGIVVTTEVNPDPDEVTGYWTDERLEEAQPMPMPEVKPGELELAE
ncbi:hypothetical protein [Nonomuraea sp. LPB2021202275-12-8]|uniref:hypothetical protein n=1 Tax=Nonomuraea sp. LPB2021202275-12-8 TaxID=3120159 RepID=UPI00300D7F19